MVIMGGSGSGKSTLLNVIGMLDSFDEGEYHFLEESVHTLKEKHRAQMYKEYIGFVFQFHHLLPEFTALENVCIPAFIAKKDQKATEENALEILTFLGSYFVF